MVKKFFWMSLGCRENGLTSRSAVRTRVLSQENPSKYGSHFKGTGFVAPIVFTLIGIETPEWGGEENDMETGNEE